MVQPIIGSSRRVDLEHTLVTTSYGKWFFGVYDFQVRVNDSFYKGNSSLVFMDLGY
jgi:hypothetical protein